MLLPIPLFFLFPGLYKKDHTSNLIYLALTALVMRYAAGEGDTQSHLLPGQYLVTIPSETDQFSIVAISTMRYMCS